MPTPHPTSDLSPRELARYQRHLRLPEVGLEGQKRLREARVLLVGVGGLGSPLALYLAAAGVGRLGLIDPDVVEESNLQRQVLYGTSDLGQVKVEVARRRLLDLNPQLHVETYPSALQTSNAAELVQDYDLVVDGCDNFATRYLVNDVCTLLGKPNVHGAIHRFQGQVSTFEPARGGPCYRCLHPEPPPPNLAPNCAEAGVLGVLPGVVGSLQATEALKWIVGCGETLRGRLLLFDALTMRFEVMTLARNPNCPLCGDEPTITDIGDSPTSCAVDPASGSGLSPEDFLARWEQGWRPLLLDVRDPSEWEARNLTAFGARLIPLDQLPIRLQELDRAADIVVHCRSGGRSAQAVELLQGAGFSRVRNLDGGLLAWPLDRTQG